MRYQYLVPLLAVGLLANVPRNSLPEKYRAKPEQSLGTFAVSQPYHLPVYTQEQSQRLSKLSQREFEDRLALSTARFRSDTTLNTLLDEFLSVRGDIPRTTGWAAVAYTHAALVETRSRDIPDKPVLPTVTQEAAARTRRYLSDPERLKKQLVTSLNTLQRENPQIYWSLGQYITKVAPAPVPDGDPTTERQVSRQTGRDATMMMYSMLFEAEQEEQ